MLRFPSPLKPLGMMLLTRGLNRSLAPMLTSRRLDFLLRKVIAIEVLDLGFSGRLTLTPDGFVPCDAKRPWDLRFRGKAKDFLRLAAGKEDPDTLFFQRQLLLEGDTALGLAIKNLLFTQDPLLGKASFLVDLLSPKR